MGVWKEIIGLILFLVLNTCVLSSQHSSEIFSESVDNQWVDKTKKEFIYDTQERVIYDANYKNLLSGSFDTQWKLMIESYYEYDALGNNSRLTCFSYNDAGGRRPQGSKNIETCDYSYGPDGESEDYDCVDKEILPSGEIVDYSRRRRVSEYENGCLISRKQEYTNTVDPSPDDWTTAAQWDYERIENCLVSFYSTSSRHDGYATVEYEYDDFGNPVRKEIIHYDRRWRIETLSRYDIQNRLVEQKEVYYGNFTDMTRSVTKIFQYDEKGNVSETLFVGVSGTDTSSIQRTSYEYHSDNGKKSRIVKEQQDSLGIWHLTSDKSYEYTVDGKPLHSLEQSFHLFGKPLLSEGSGYYGFNEKFWNYDFYGYLISDKSVSESYEGDSLTHSHYKLTDYRNRCDGLNIESVYQSESPVGGPHKAPYRKYRYVRTYPSEPRCDDDTNEKNLLIYPNPTSDYCIVQSDVFKDRQGDVNLRVVDSNGRVLLSKRSEVSYRSGLNVSSLPAGVYFVELSHSGERMAGSFLKL